MKFTATPLGTVVVSCPVCVADVKVDIVCDDGVIRDGELVVKLATRYDHSCPPQDRPLRVAP